MESVWCSKTDCQGCLVEGKLNPGKENPGQLPGGSGICKGGAVLGSGSQTFMTDPQEEIHFINKAKAGNSIYT